MAQAPWWMSWYLKRKAPKAATAAAMARIASHESQRGS
jgi:hypothetical protein